MIKINTNYTQSTVDRIRCRQKESSTDDVIDTFSVSVRILSNNKFNTTDVA